MIKALLLVFVSLPVLGFIDLGAFAWILGAFAPHWGAQVMFAAVTGGPMITPAIGALASAIPPLALVLWIIARRVRLNGSR